MKTWHTAILLLCGVALAGCTTYGSHRKVGTYTYKGKGYDVYEAVADHESRQRQDDSELIRFIVDKGVAPPDRPGGKIIASCDIEKNGGESESSVRKRCNKRFGAAIEKRDNPVEESSDGGMY